MPKTWWRNEDWLAVALGALFLIAIALGFPFALPGLKWANAPALVKVLSDAPKALILCIIMLVVSFPGAMGLGVKRYAIGFPVIFVLAWIGQIIASNATVAYWGIEYVIFALILGLVMPAPAWLKECARTEYFIKTGLVIMGATILFDEIVAAGALGMLQAVLVVSVVWYIAYAIAKRCNLDDEFAAIMASAVSICGVSAAIATCGAIQGDRKKLSYVASIVLIVAVPMIILMPWAVRALHLTDAVGGAWLGGTLDTTGSVVAAGALISEKAMKIGTIVKFSQNVLLGVAAFLLAIWWTFKQPANDQQKPSASLIWERFPKFVLGFVAASIVFSFLVPPATIKQTASIVAGLRTWWFACAFVSIGLETNFRELVSNETGSHPLIAFISAQTANIVWTLLLAELIFGGHIFQAP